MVSITGIAGAILFIVKIVVHIYIRSSIREDVYFGSFGNYTRPLYFLPIMERVTGKLRITKVVGNVIYWIAIVLIVIFVILFSGQPDR